MPDPRPWGAYLDIVQAQIRFHPEFNLAGEDHERGRLVDAVAVALNGGTIEGPWGRKARLPNGGNRNGDALSYLLPGGRFELVDIIRGLDSPPDDRISYAGWDPKGSFAPGENGYWAKADPVGIVGPSPTDPPDTTALEARLAALEANCRANGSAAQRALLLLENLRLQVDRNTQNIPAGTDLSALRSSLQALEGKVSRLVVESGRTDSRGVGLFAHSHQVPRLSVVDSKTLPPEAR